MEQIDGVHATDASMQPATTTSTFRHDQHLCRKNRPGYGKRVTFTALVSFDGRKQRLIVAKPREMSSKWAHLALPTGEKEVLVGSLTAPGCKLPSGEVTFLFTDIEGSTRLACELGDDYRKVLHEHRRLLRKVFSCRDGSELLTEGDSFFVAFSDAFDAVDAAITAQESLTQHPWPTAEHWRGPARPKVRMGLHTGYAVPDSQGYATSIVHRAARVCAAAHGDQILCSRSTLDACGRMPDGTRSIYLGCYRLRGFDDSEQLHQLTTDALPQLFPPPPDVERRQHNLPAEPDPFIGRDEEQRDLERLLVSHRLISVTALPKTGKSRLVKHVGRNLADRYPDGSWYADLSAYRDLGSALASAFGFRDDPFRPELDCVIERLRSRECLIILDDAHGHHAAPVTRLLAECPGIRVLSTSQQPLGLVGEVKWALPTMSATDAATLMRHRAMAASGGIDPGDCGDLAAYVDGFPPAVNILASLLPFMKSDRLLRKLRAEKLSLLDARGELSAILDDVHDQLSPRAAHLLRALSAWPAAAGVDEVERLCGGAGAALDALINLVDMSLVDIHRTDGEAVYRLPAPVRWYADYQRQRNGESIPSARCTPTATRMPPPRLSWASAPVK